MRIRKPTSRWFEFENDPDNGRVKIKYLEPVQAQDSWTEAFAWAIDKFPDADQSGANFMAMVNQQTVKNNSMKSIDEWENVFDDNGHAMECNEPNIMAAIDRIPGFHNAIVGFRNELDKIVESDQKDQEKN